MQQMEKTMGVRKGLRGLAFLLVSGRDAAHFAAREETIPEAKQEYEQKSQELQKIQTELGKTIGGKAMEGH